MNPKLPKLFNLAAGLILVAMATAEVFGNQGAVIVQPADPILGISSRYPFWALAIVKSAVAAVCLFSTAERLKHMMVFWLASYLVLYRLGLLCTGVHFVTAYFERMAANFGLSPGAMSFLFSLGVGFLWFDSGAHFFFCTRTRDKGLRRWVKDSLPSATKAPDPTSV